MSDHTRAVLGPTRILVVALAVAFTAPGARAVTFPPYQAAVVEFSGDVSCVHVADGRSVPVAVTAGQSWPVGDDLVVAEGKGWAKVAVSDLAWLLFQAGTTARLEPGAGAQAASPPQVVVREGAGFAAGKGGVGEALSLKLGSFTLELKGAQVYLKAAAGKVMVVCNDGSVTVSAKDKRHPVAKGEAFLGLDEQARGQVKPFPPDKFAKLAKAFAARLAEPPPALPDRVPPRVQILSPKGDVPVGAGEVTVKGIVDDPSIKSVKVEVQGEFRKLEAVASGRFEFTVKLHEARNEIKVVAEDDARNSKPDIVSVQCTKPQPRSTVPSGNGGDEPKSPLQSAIDKVKRFATDTRNPLVFIAMVLLGGLLLFLGYLLIRRIYFASKKSIQKAGELATGIVFQRCEKCGNREYHYHLFYTTETVNSPFLRNLINNVNPMATSMMNESLESLLSTGLKWSQKAKQAENKIRVICSWCDFCKMGTLSLEHLQGSSVSKVDDYQIIHPIFIEWVRKVYD